MNVEMIVEHLKEIIGLKTRRIGPRIVAYGDLEELVAKPEEPSKTLKSIQTVPEEAPVEVKKVGN